MRRAARLRWLLLATVLGAGPAVAQAPPSGLPPGLPPNISAADAMALYQTLTPQQKQMLAAKGLTGNTSVTPAEALAWYQSMTPQQKQMARDWAQQQLAANPALKDQLKSLYKAWRGQ